MSFERIISFRYLRAKRKQTFISLITLISIGGVAIGVSALIVVLAVMTGAQDDIKGKILGANPHIVITAMTDMDRKTSRRVVKTARSMPGVISAESFIFNQVIITSGEKVAGVAIRGIVPAGGAQKAGMGRYMLKGGLVALDKKHVRVTVETDDFGSRSKVKRAGIILGNELARALRVRMDDPVSVVSPMGRMTPMGMTPISREFYVAGIFHSGMYEYDSSLALVSIRQAQALLKMGKGVTGVEVKLEDPYDAGEIGEELQEEFGFKYRVRNWQEMNRNLFFALALEKTVIGLILVLIILVAAFNIVSTLIMVALEKTRDIAILKAMGASSGSIMKIFLIEGLIIGLLGDILGVIGGVIMCQLLDRYHFIKLPSDVYNLDTLPVAMRISDVVVISVIALLITALAALYPAWGASRVDPAESLRYE